MEYQLFCPVFHALTPWWDNFNFSIYFPISPSYPKIMIWVLSITIQVTVTTLWNYLHQFQMKKKLMLYSIMTSHWSWTEITQINKDLYYEMHMLIRLQSMFSVLPFEHEMHWDTQKEWGELQTRSLAQGASSSFSPYTLHSILLLLVCLALSGENQALLNQQSR